MFKIFVFITAFLIFPPSSYADNIKNLCRVLNSSSDNMVAADYVAGVDVNGNAVVPADLGSNGTLSSLYDDPIIIPIRIDIAKRYGLNLPLGADLKPTIADIKIFSDGHVKYNNSDISNNISTFCKNYDDEIKKIQSNQLEQHRHESSDPVISSDKIEGSYPQEDIAQPHYND